MKLPKFFASFKFLDVLIKKTVTLSFIIICNSNIDAIAQKSWFEDQSPHSPNVSALGKFGDIPVGNYTGTPQISVPIYTMKSGEITVPITLKYHASGLRVNDMASWVGLGWALDAGGYVARRVRGTADEGPRDGGKNGIFNGYYQNFGPNMVLEGAPENYFVIDGVLNGSHDVEPDLFFFSFGSFSGSFFFDQYRKPHLLPEQDLKIDVNYSEGSPGKFNQFIITTPDGVKYYFGGFGSNAIEAIEYTFPNFPANFVNNGYISNWYLTKVANSDNTDIITFEYVQESYQFFNLSQFQQILKEGNCGGVSNPNTAYSEDKIDGVRLSKIISVNATTEFIADLVNPRKDVHGGNSYILKTISINPNSSVGTTKYFELSSHWENCPGLQLNQGENIALTEDKWRLFLDQVQENAGSTVQNPPYKFSYYQLPSSTDATDIPKLPRRLTYDQDHWGYFNNAGNTYLKWLLPTIAFPTFSCSTINSWGAADREPHWPAMRAGTIKSIQYPTKGNTVFEFESHSYDAHWTEPLIAKTFPISVGNGASSGTNSQIVDYTFPSPASGESLSVELSATVTVQSSNTNCAEVFLYDDNNGGVLIAGSSFNCSQTPYPSKIIPLTLVSGQAYMLRLVATNCMAQLIVSSAKTVNKEGNKSVGGLRIYKITDSTADNGPNISKLYQYSNAVLFSVPTYFREIIDNSELDCLTCEQDGGKKLYNVSSGSVMPMVTSQGNHIGYSNVTVAQEGLGKSVFTYENNSLGSYMALQFLKYPTPPPPYILENGNLKHEIHYDESNNIVKEIDYQFETKINTDINVPASNIVSVFIPPACRAGADAGGLINGFPLSRWTNYFINTGFSRLHIKTVTDHFVDGDVTSTFSYEYSPYYKSQVSSETQERSDKKVIKKLTMYPKDYLPAYQYSPICYDQLQISLHQCLQEYNSSLCNDCYSTCVENQKNNYISCIGNYNTNYYNLIDFDKANSDATTKIYYQMWNMNKIQPIERTIWIKDNQDATIFTLTSANFFEYGKFTNNTTGIEDIKLSSVHEVPQKVNLSDFSSSGVNNKTFFKDNRYEKKVSTLYTRGRLTELWENDNIHTQYYFGYNNSLLIVKAENIDNSTLINLVATSLPSGFSTLDGLLNAITTLPNNNWSTFNQNLRSGVPYGTIVTTYTYSPLIGMTSQTDPNGVATYYEYDDFGRLKLLKDKDGKILKTYNYHYKQ